MKPITLSEIEKDPDLEVSTVCACGCGRLLLKKHKRHRYFSNSCRYKAKESGTARMMQRRARFSRWYDKKRPGHQRCPQLARPPIVGDFLPGAAVMLSFDGYSPTLQTSRSIHGLVTGLLGIPHDEMVPTFSCAPYGSGWGIYSPNDDAIRKLAGRKVQNAVFGVEQTLSFGPLMRLRYPIMPNARGWRLLRVDAITPVVIKSTHTKTGKTRVRQAGTERLLLGSMVSLAKFRLGIDLSDKTLCSTIESHVMPESVDVGGKLGIVRGFSGYVIVRTNAVGEWILRVAEQIGLGSRVGFGFGRIKVTEYSQDEASDKTGAAGKFFVTPHAVKRYIQRVHNSASYEQALYEIIHEAKGAHFVRGCSHSDTEEADEVDGVVSDKAELWRSSRPMRLRLIVGRENPGLPQIVTILPGVSRD